MSLKCGKIPCIIPPGTNSTGMPSVVQVHFSLIISAFTPNICKCFSYATHLCSGEIAMKARLVLVSIALFAAALIFPTTALADGIIIPDPPVCLPEPCFPSPISISQLEIRYHHVDVVIDDQIALTRVDQVFYNPNDWTVEGTYIFPIPLDAAVTEFTLWIDGEPVKGEILSAEEARRTYETIVREMQDPALLEYADRGAVQARIFPILSGTLASSPRY